MKTAKLLNVKTFFAVLAAVSTVSNGVSAGDVDLSAAIVAPTGETTIRLYEVKYAPTPDFLYIVDFFLDEETLRFEFNGATAVDPSDYEGADVVRGGLLYDNWWKINGESEPSENYARYPDTSSQSGSGTWRCKECHGWDYKGNEGAYEIGSSHYTDIEGLYQVKNRPMAYIYGAIVDHNIPSLSEPDIWDLTKFLKEGTVDMNKYIVFSGAQSKSATGDADNGRTLYENSGGCLKCHGADGNKIAAVSVGAIANSNPWETLHKIRFGNSGTKMPAMISKGLSFQEQLDILTYAQTLPPIETEAH